MTQSGITLFVFAKAPIAGKVKTRLLEHCSAELAAKIAEVLLDTTLSKATKEWPGPVVLSVGLDASHPVITQLAQKYSIAVAPQASGNLGQRMQATVDSVASRASSSVAILGADACLVSGNTLRVAYAKLSAGENVIGPSLDGGYYLIGLQRSVPKIFENIDWGSEFVFRQTLQQAKRANVALASLEPIYDIDTWQDVLLAAEQIPALAALLN